MHLGSPDNKDLWTNKLILNSNPALIGKKCEPMASGVILSALHLYIFKMNLKAAFKIISKSCKSVFGKLAVHITMHSSNLLVSELSDARLLT